MVGANNSTDTAQVVYARLSYQSAAVTFVTAGDTYPADITPPPGTQYPCALTALPRALPGIPETDRAYINRTYARLLRTTQSLPIILQCVFLGLAIEGPLAPA